MFVHASRLLTLVLVALVAACSGSGMNWFGRGGDSTGATPREVPGVEARLVALGSGINGMVRVRESGDILVVRADFGNLMPGVDYRIVFHENGNCSSPNGFSAGAPWSPPGFKGNPSQMIPVVRANTEGNGVITARLRGLSLGGPTGLVKRSVIVYQGFEAQPLKPDVRNNAAACGVFQPATTLF